MRRLRDAGGTAAASGPRRRSALALGTAALLLVGVPARADEPLHLVSVTAADSRVSVVADVPAPATMSDPAPVFEVLDGPDRLPVEATAVLDPRRTVTLVVDAGAASSPDGLADLQRTATELVLRVGTEVQLGVVASARSAPVLLEPQGVGAAAAALNGLRAGAGDAEGLAPAVRAAGRRGLTGVASPHVVVVVAAGAADVPAEDLGRELADGRGLVYAIAPGGVGADYWREVADIAGGAVEPAGGRAAGSLAGQLARQHVVGFPAPREDGSVRLLARTPAGTWTADVALAPASRDGSTPGERRTAGRWLMATAALLLVLVAGGHLFEMGAARRRRGRAGHAGPAAGPAALPGGSVRVGAHRRDHAAARARGTAPTGAAVVGTHRRAAAAPGAEGVHGSGSHGSRVGADAAGAVGAADLPTRAAHATGPAAPGSSSTQVAAGPGRPPETPAEQVTAASSAHWNGEGKPALDEAALDEAALDEAALSGAARPGTAPVPPLTSVDGQESTTTPRPHVPRHAREDDGAGSGSESEVPGPRPVEVPRQRARAPRQSDGPRQPDGPEPPAPSS